MVVLSPALVFTSTGDDDAVVTTALPLLLLTLLLVPVDRKVIAGVGWADEGLHWGGMISGAYIPLLAQRVK